VIKPPLSAAGGLAVAWLSLIVLPVPLQFSRAQTTGLCAAASSAAKPALNDRQIRQRLTFATACRRAAGPRWRDLRIPQLSSLLRPRAVRQITCDHPLRRGRARAGWALRPHADCPLSDGSSRRVSLPEALIVPPNPHTAPFLAELGLPLIDGVPPIAILHGHRHAPHPTVDPERPGHPGRSP
jgi:hypothetical protein